MSQKKVDAYKEKKANREKIMKKEKAVLRLEKTIGLLVAVVIVFWVCFSVYDKITDGAMDVQTETVMDTSALDSYTSALAMEDSEVEAEEDTDEEADTEGEADVDADADDAAEKE